jgi:peptidoglycan/LPS O-acetylase OafA/YrhL
MARPGPPLEGGPNLNHAQGKRIAGLDAIRFVCAFSVVESHSPGLVAFAERGGRVALLAAKLVRDAFNGPAAVIVFFIISGFCIHWPHRNGKGISADYFLRRYIRIGGPLAAAVLICPWLGIPVADLAKSILWSLYCELIYYTLYPLLLHVAARFGWHRLTAVAFLVAFAWALARPNRDGNYASANAFSASLLGLPCWLMGCVLAERQPLATPSTKNIWLWRSAVYFSSVFVLELRFHSSLHFDLTLNFFGVLCLYWLPRELVYNQTTPPPSWLERAGAWSYSLYVFHVAAIALPGRLFPHWSEAAQWFIRSPLTLAVCYLFYRLFEEPSHRLARAAAAAVRPAVP